MTKMSANPRKYSKGIEHLNPDQALNVYMRLRTNPGDLDITLARLDFLTEKHSDSISKVVEITREDGDAVITVEISMGPARDALQGTSIQVNAGYKLLWDIAKTLFHTRPIFCAPPHLGSNNSNNLR